MKNKIEFYSVIKIEFKIMSKFIFSVQTCRRIDIIS